MKERGKEINKERRKKERKKGQDIQDGSKNYKLQ